MINVATTTAASEASKTFGPREGDVRFTPFRVLLFNQFRRPRSVPDRTSSSFTFDFRQIIFLNAVAARKNGSIGFDFIVSGPDRSGQFVGNSHHIKVRSMTRKLN